MHPARREQAEPLYEAFCRTLVDEGIEVARGVFGARLEVQIANDGPVTIVLKTQVKTTCYPVCNHISQLGEVGARGAHFFRENEGR